MKNVVEERQYLATGGTTYVTLSRSTARASASKVSRSFSA
jgi:hypothetical protein